MLNAIETNNKSCNIIDISNRNKYNGTGFDFNSLLPKSEQLSKHELEEIENIEKQQITGQGDDCIPLEILNKLLNYFLEKRDFRSVLWITLQANTGLRYVDVSKLRKIDLINNNDMFRESVFDIEQKTGKKRTNFINNSIKMATLLYLWDNPQIQALDYLIVADKKASYKGYEKETYINKEGKIRAVRRNGKYVYKTDAYGNKIPKPLSLSRTSEIMRDALINGLGVSIKNDKRTCKNSDSCLKLASHSLRKAYASAVVDYFIKQFDSDKEYAHAAAMEQLQYDLNHSSRRMTYHYIGDYVETKRKINMSMNLGIEVIQPFFENEVKLRGDYKNGK